LEDPLSDNKGIASKELRSVYETGIGPHPSFCGQENLDTDTQYYGVNPAKSTIPSGKHRKNHRKSPFFNEKLHYFNGHFQ
jgi:hypothetical protein